MADHPSMVPVPAPRPRLAQARYQHGWSQQQLADLLGTTPLNVSRWERGLTHPSPYFRQRLASVLDLKPQELDALLSDSPASEAEMHPAQPADAAGVWDPGIPLPNGLVPLVGRETQLVQLKQRLQGGQKVALSALGGLPGVGKTALALALVYDAEMRAHFADGILWAGLGPQPNVLAILSRWGRLLGLSQSDASRLTSREQWQQMLRGLIGARRMLLVLDDAWQLEEALGCLVGGPNCAYILTTRLPQLALSFAPEPLVVPELEEEPGLRLLEQLAPEVVAQEPQGVRSLLRLVGGLPLALCLMGNYLRAQGYSGQPRRIRAATERLRRSEARLQLAGSGPLLEPGPALAGSSVSLQTVIAVSERQVSEAARKALHALSVFPAKPNSFSEEAGLAVSEEGVEALDELSDAGLVESVGPGRYTLHQTVADYARLQVQESSPKERLIAYSVTYAEAHAKDYPTLERESSMLIAALEACEELERGADLVRLSLALGPFWKARGEYALAQQYLQRTLEAARTLGWKSEQIRVLLLLGDVSHPQGDYEQAERYYEQGLALARQEEDHEQVCEALAGLGWIVYKKGDYVRTETLLEEGLALARQQGYVHQQARLLHVLGANAFMQGKFEQSQAYREEALSLARQLFDHELTCRLLNDLGGGFSDMGDMTRGLSYMQEGLALARQMGYRQWESLLLANLVMTFVDEGEYEQAEYYAQESLVVARQVGMPERVCLALGNLADLTLARGKFEEAERYAQEGLALARQTGIPEQIYRLLATLGEIATARGNYEEAEHYLKEGLDLTRQAAGGPWIAVLLTYLGELALAREDCERVERYIQEGLDLAGVAQIPYVLSDLLYLHGELYLRRQQIAEAAQDFEEILNSLPQEARKDRAQAQYGLARVAAARGDLPQAQQLGRTSLAALEQMGHRLTREVRTWLSALNHQTEQAQ